MSVTAGIYTVRAIHFRPYAETGEFACVGMVIYSRTANYLNCRFADNHQLKRLRKRIQGFFPELDDEILKNTIRYVKTELMHLDGLLRRGDMFYPADWLIEDFLRPRENVICFGPASVVMCSDPLKELNAQFERIVMRGFLDVEGTYIHEMKTSIQHSLDRANIKYSQDYLVKAPYNYDIKIPFVSAENACAWALKPLDLKKNKAREVVDRLLTWKYDAKIIAESMSGIRILCPIRYAEQGTDAYDAANDMLSQNDNLFKCCSYKENSADEILSFLCA